jgi:hypothetical protein
MGILDEAIREHLELKRQHGAADSELKQLEDEAFGQAERPGDEAAVAHDPAAEAPTEFMTQPEVPEQPSSRREGPTIADLQEPPPPPESVPAAEEAPGRHAAAEPAAAAEEPAHEGAPAEEQPAMEHEVVDVPEAGAGTEAEPEVEVAPEAASHSTEERHAIAEQPTELHDVEEELAAEGPPSPTDEELVEEEIAEPRLAPTDPLAGLDQDDEAEVTIQGPAPDDDEDYEDEDDAFWNEQRLSDELDKALEAPSESTVLAEDLPPAEEPPLEAEPPLTDEHEAVAPEADVEPETRPAGRAEDVLEETPDFLEEAPEDDQLWFEQKPPKDFDFDD